MDASQRTAERSWGRVAQHLAQRVNRRSRAVAALGALNGALLAGGIAAVAFRALLTTGAADRDRMVVAALFGAGLLIGLAFGLGRARRVHPVGAGDAAWALDRLAGARGRGIAAAVAKGPAAAEAAWADPLVAPPERVVLHPPRGLVATVAALGLFALAFLAPVRGAAETSETTLRVGGTGPGAGGGVRSLGGEARAEAAETAATALDDRAAEARRIRRLLNLPAEGPLDPVEVAERLADVETRKKAAAAAAPGTPLSEALQRGDTQAEALARLLAAGEAAPAAASGQRRDAVRERAGVRGAPIPPGRRALVTRYLERVD